MGVDINTLIVIGVILSLFTIVFMAVILTVMTIGIISYIDYLKKETNGIQKE